MSLSQSWIQKRRQERKNFQKTFAYTLVISSLLHVVLALAVIQVSKKPQKPEKEQIEFALIELAKPNIIPEETEEDTSQNPPITKPQSGSIPTTQQQIKSILNQQKNSDIVSKKSRSQFKPQARKKPRFASNRLVNPITNKHKPVLKPRNNSTFNPSKTPPISSRNINPTKPQVSKEEKIPRPDLNSSPNSQLTRENANVNASANNNNRVNSQESQTIAAARSASKPTKQKAKKKVRLSCISRCLPSYPSVLNGAEGSVTVRIVINRQGNVVSATLAVANSNPRINQQALIAARKMKFAPFQEREQITGRLKINFILK